MPTQPASALVALRVMLGPGSATGGLILRISSLASLTAVAAAVLGFGQAAHADLLIESTSPPST